MSLFAVAAAFLETGCLYTTHHFNSGRLLEPGKTAVTFGVGTQQVYTESCPDGYYNDIREGNRLCRPDAYGGPVDQGEILLYDTNAIRPDLETMSIPKLSLSYRLGVRGQWGPFTGVELGWLVEAPTNPGTVEFDVKLGLPLDKRFRAHHSLSAGWGVGMWADNSYFLEYAASRDLGAHSLYSNYRFT
ncbi:MAG: hypothetical protein ABI036_03665, partial [Fibrobacteria bacterium]